MGIRRYAGIRVNTGAPRDVLTKRLRSLEAAGTLERRQYRVVCAQCGEPLEGADW
ncbi:hypothetical protein ACWD7F_33385 [Streptomyces sp. NPDC005122]